MEALDNPSYFSLPGGTSAPVASRGGPFLLLKRRGATMGAQASSCSSAPTTPTTPEAAAAMPLLLPSPSPPAPVPFSHHRRSFRSLLRSMSANSSTNNQHHLPGVYQLQHQLLVLGEPRPSDMAPESIAHQQHRRNHSNKSLELLSNDMVYCPVPEVPAPTASEELLSASPEEVFLGNGGDARYYNLTIPLPGATRRRHSIGTFLHKDRGSCGSLSTPTAISVPVTPVSEAVPSSNDALQKLSSTSLGAKTTPPPEWRHPASTSDVPRSVHSRRRCARCCNAKGRPRLCSFINYHSPFTL
ncbi:hypothetical protein C0J52_16269 [Blattella germanica]|nr:hypothetical protein C0J52_16269 [Blattella germanica]